MTTYFISGHLDLTPEEFEEHYVPHLERALAGDAGVRAGVAFVVGDAPRGADRMAQDWLVARGVAHRLTVYHMLVTARYAVDEARCSGGFRSDGERDRALTMDSDVDIAWVRPGREDSGTARNLKRRAKCSASKTPSL